MAENLLVIDYSILRLDKGIQTGYADGIEVIWLRAIWMLDHLAHITSSRDVISIEYMASAVFDVFLLVLRLTGKEELLLYGLV